ncbi:MAG TPA: PilN domain-containing protein [Gaiellaceae bacterium]|jgi:Tfp pilus assembly protein PilN|nr:PilN domain-containing protein [Gaiellaceae bacterium]
MRAVNLLPKDETQRSRKQTSWPVVIGLAGSAVVIAALGAGLLQTRGAVSERQDELQSVSAELAAMPAAADKPADRTAELAAERGKRAAALASAFTYHVSWDRVLRRFALVLPDDVWLTSLTAKAPKIPGPDVVASTTDAAPSGFTITGYTYSQEGVARLLARLSVLPDLTNVQLQTSALTDIGERPVIQFTILANVRAGGSPS